MATYVCVYLGAAVLALLATPLVIRVARRIDAVDRPGVRTVHESPIPRIGGVAIFLAAMATIVAVLCLDSTIGDQFRPSRAKLLTLLGSATFIFLLGLIDDLRGLPTRCKFLAELVAAIVLCIAGIKIQTISLTSDITLPLKYAGGVLTVLWVVGITNAVNLSDGLDGLAAGVSAVACAVIAIFAIHSGLVIMAVLMLALAGSLCGFLVFNFNPAKVFMGDCGSLFLGFLIAGASVMCVAKSTALVGLALPALALGVPIFDTLFSMLRRFLERRSLFAPDRRHFHHRLLSLGLSQRHAVLTIYIITLVVAGLGLFMMIRNDFRALVLFGCLLLLHVLLFRVVGAVRWRETVIRLREKYARAQCRKQEQRTFENLQLQFRRVRDTGQWWQAICDAARRMDFAYLALRTIHADGRIEEEIWRAPQPKPGFSRLVTMTVPLEPGHPGTSQQLEVAIWANGSLEDAGHRATLFSRLIDETEITFSHLQPAVSS